MNWGHKIIMSLVAFAMVLTTMVVIAMRQNTDLVEKDYYQKELAFQDHIDQIENRTVDFADAELFLIRDEPILRLNLNKKVTNGKVHLFRPSDAKEDLILALKTDANGQMDMSTLQLKPGNWKVKIDWQLDNRSYYFERDLIIP